MGIIREEIHHEEFKVGITVDEKEDGEVVEPWRFCCLEVDSFEDFTPKELKQLGLWLVQEGTRLGRQYTSRGAPRAAGRT